ncbi:hypothetical protein [Paenibacillus mesophilus]|nr:hypothetical protein [Paenibacillus mesophilus]
MWLRMFHRFGKTHGRLNTTGVLIVLLLTGMLVAGVVRLIL